MREKSSRRRGRARGVLSAMTLSIAAAVVIAIVLGSTLGSYFAPRAADGQLQPSICNGGQWNSSHLVLFAGCSAVFTLEYAPENFSAPNGTYFFFFEIPWIAEVTHQGKVVQAASANTNPTYGQVSTSGVPGNVNVTLVETMNVQSDTGNWTPWGVYGGETSGWNFSGGVVGSTTLIVSFHLVNESPSYVPQNGSLGVEFDVSVLDWPWLSADDSLGFALSVNNGESSSLYSSSYLTYNATSRTLAEVWNTTNTTFASLLFGTTAQVNYSSATFASATVVEQVGIFPGGADVPSTAMTLSTFANVTGDYSEVSYDPWVVFSVPGVSVPSPALNSGSANLVVALVVGAALVGSSALALVAVRTVRLRREGEELVRRMQEVIRREREPPGRGH